MSQILEIRNVYSIAKWQQQQPWRVELLPGLGQSACADI
jgi:hypothetical protein